MFYFFWSRLRKPFFKTFYHIESCCPRPNGRNQNHINNNRMLYELMSEQTVLTLSCPYKKMNDSAISTFSCFYKKKITTHLQKKHSFLSFSIYSRYSLPKGVTLISDAMSCCSNFKE